MSSSSRVVLWALACVAGTAAVAALAGPVAGAGAAGETLTLTNMPGPAPGSTVAAKATGAASGDSVLLVYLERDGVGCAANAADHSIRDGVSQVGADPANPDPSATLTAGPYDVVIRWAPYPAGTYRLCGYLYGSAQLINESPLALATTVLTMIDDNDADGVPDGSDACPDEAGTGPDGCPPRLPVAPVTPTLPAALPSPRVPSAPVPALPDPTGVKKLKSSKGKSTACGAGCLTRTRTVGPFSFALTVKVAGGSTTASGSVTLARKSAQAGTTGKVCLGRFAATAKQKCRKVTWKVGRKITLTGSITTPSTIRKSGRPGFGLSAQVGVLPVGGGDSIYLRQAGKRVVPDTNEAACISSATAHMAC